MLAEDGQQFVRQVDDAFGAVLWGSYRAGAAFPLQLSGDHELSSQEVDVTDLDTRRLAETQAGKGTQRDVGSEVLCGSKPVGCQRG